VLVLTYCPFSTVHQPLTSEPSGDYHTNIGNSVRLLVLITCWWLAQYWLRSWAT